MKTFVRLNDTIVVDAKDISGFYVVERITRVTGRARSNWFGIPIDSWEPNGTFNVKVTLKNGTEFVVGIFQSLGDANNYIDKRVEYILELCSRELEDNNLEGSNND